MSVLGYSLHAVVCEVSGLRSLETWSLSSSVLVLLRVPCCPPHEETATTEHEAFTSESEFSAAGG